MHAFRYRHLVQPLSYTVQLPLAGPGDDHHRLVANCSSLHTQTVEI